MKNGPSEHMFDSKHYIPILRWKAAEREALAKLDSECKQFVTPLIELIMPQPKSNKNADGRLKNPEELWKESVELLKGAVPKIPKDILKSWGKDPAFLDVNLLDASVRAKKLTEILADAGSLGLSLLPVVGMNSDKAIQEAAVAAFKKYKHGLCLRLFRSDLNDPNALSEKMKLFLWTYSTSEKEIDLLIDLQIADEGGSDLTEFCQSVPDIVKWKTFTIASGAFPPDLVNIPLGLNYRDRDDWKSWLKQINADKLPRIPSYADYTIQHPIYKEPPRGSNPSASIRYTLNDRWMIMRGQALRSEKSAGHAQYPALAQLVSKQPEFFGAAFSYGDQYIVDTGKDIKTKNTGTPRTWIRAGINHHIKCVVSQLSTLS